jgi:putative DNA methylase
VTFEIKSPRKLIEVALPLDAINEAAAKEKSIRHGHPSTLHLWWARRPLAAARAVIFAQMVNDPSWKWELEHPGEMPPGNLKASWAASRKRLFSIIEDLVKWENTANEEVLAKARAEIRKSWAETCELNKGHPQAAELFDPKKIPSFHDPFAGGGSLPLEAQRLGLESYASDLNPIAVLINKATIEIPPKFSGRPPVNPEARASRDAWSKQWARAQGLADDVRYYGQWVREQALKRIGNAYPPIEITQEIAKERDDLRPLVGQKLTVIAWIWTRTVKSPNPAFSHVDVPLASTFVLSSKAGKESYVQPVVEGDGYLFTVKLGKPPAHAKEGTKLSRGANFRCLLSDTPIEPNYIKSEGQAGRMATRLMAIIAEGPTGRIYCTPTEQMEKSAKEVESGWQSEMKLPHDPRNFWTVDYGLRTFGSLFTQRQLAALSAFSDLATEVRHKVREDAMAAGIVGDGKGLNLGGKAADAYAEAVSVYLSLGVGRSANYWSSLTPWGGEFIVQTFGRNALPMVWDFAEANPFSSSTGNWTGALAWIENVITRALPANTAGFASQEIAQKQTVSQGKVVSTDPPYYDNIGYADLSDYFYVWLRKSVRDIYPDIFSTLGVPKADELVATPYRHGGKEKAEKFFLNGMTEAMQRVAEQSHQSYPVTIYYAYKQSESSNSGTSSAGWVTFLSAVLEAGFSIGGTWPMRTERDQGLKTGTNSLASSIVLVCRPRSPNAESISRRAFLRELNQVLPEALDQMTRASEGERSPVAPVDLSQAIIGPGMAVFSKYASVLEADGTQMSVQTANNLINGFLAEDDFDHDTQFCLHWFEQYGWKEGRFGEADTLARAKGTAVDGVKHAGVIDAAGGIVRLLRWSEYPSDWSPTDDNRLPVWEALHHLIRVFKADGETGAGKVLAVVEAKAEATRQLAYRLYTLCERAGWAEDARAYNEIITSWTAIESAATAAPQAHQRDLFG